MEGIDALLDALDRYTAAPVCGTEFSARVFKISRDAQGARLTHLKITGGVLRQRAALRYQSERGEMSPVRMHFWQVHTRWRGGSTSPLK